MGPLAFLLTLSSQTLVAGAAEEVTTANAYFRRTATGADGTFSRTATTGHGTFRRTVTTADTER